MGKKFPFIGIQAGRSYPDGTIETHMPPLQSYPQSWEPRHTHSFWVKFLGLGYDLIQINQRSQIREQTTLPNFLYPAILADAIRSMITGIHFGFGHIIQ